MLECREGILRKELGWRKLRLQRNSAFLCGGSTSIAQAVPERADSAIRQMERSISLREKSDRRCRGWGRVAVTRPKGRREEKPYKAGPPKLFFPSAKMSPRYPCLTEWRIAPGSARVCQRGGCSLSTGREPLTMGFHLIFSHSPSSSKSPG